MTTREQAAAPRRGVLPANAQRLALRKLASEIDFAFRPAAAESGLCTQATASTPREDPREQTRARGAAKSRLGVRLVETQNAATILRLQLDVHDLRQQIARLQELKHGLVARAGYRRIHWEDAVRRRAMSYFDVFRYGLHTDQRLHDLQTCSVVTPVRVADQMRFLRDTMTPDLHLGNAGVGIENLVQQWHRYSSWFHVSDYCVETLRLVCDFDDDGSAEQHADADAGASTFSSRVLIHITTTCRLGVTQDTLAHGFPHVASNAPLAQRLVGQTLFIASDVRFYFNADGQIDRYDDETHFLNAFHAVLRDPRDLAFVLGEANVDAVGYLGERGPERLDDSVQEVGALHGEALDADGHVLD